MNGKPTRDEMERANFIVSIHQEGYTIEHARYLAEKFYQRKWWRKLEGRENGTTGEDQSGSNIL